MADEMNTSTIQHITELDFDISKIDEQFKEIENKTKNLVENLQDILNKNKVSFDSNFDFSGSSKSIRSSSPESTIKKINTLYERSSTLVKNIRNSNIDNEELTERINANLEESKLLWDKIHSGSQDVTDEIKNQVKQLDLQTDYLESQFKTIKNLSVPAPESMFKTWGDKFKTAFSTAFAFRMTQYAEDAVVETLRTLKEVEFGVMEITRILNDSSIDVQEFTHDIFDLATEYGRTFDEAQEIVLRFAQTGKSAAESLQLAADTMLALNTAEFNTEEATQSLIGVMQQWGYTTEEYLGVIDRINITADNFAVTSQDLVDALLKSSSVAKNAGLSFEELIGILTVMKEASGAAGKEVGNAAKTILTYLQRPTSLEYFDSIGVEVYANKITGELLPAMEILQNMSNKWNSSNQEMQNNFMDAADKAGLFNEEIADSLGVMEDYSGATDAYTKALADSTTEEERNMATKAANVHRLNYYMALMENFSKVQEVVTGMQEADGYSMRENAKYMDTLAAKYNQFVTTLKEIATTAGEGGLTSVAKSALDLATNFAQLMTTTEGLVAVLGSLLGIIILIKREAVGKAALELLSTIKFATQSLMGFFKVIASGNISLASFKASLGGITATNIAGWVGIGIAALSLLSAAVSKINAEMEEYRKELIESGNAAYENASNLNELVYQYEKIQSVQNKTQEQESELKQLNQEIVKLLGERSIALKGLKEGTDEYTESLKKLTLEEVDLAYIEATKARKAAGESLLYAASPRQAGATSIFKIPEDALKSYEQANEELNNLNKQIIELTKSGKEEEAQAISNSKRYEALNKSVNSLSNYAENYVETLAKQITLDAIMANDGIPKTREEIEKLNNVIFEATGLDEQWKNIVEEVSSQLFPELSNSSEKTANSIDELNSVSEEVTYYLEQMEEKIAETTDGLSGMKNAYSTLTSAMSEYNENGYFSIDTLSKLIQLEPRYLQYLIDENGNLKLNEQALREATVAELDLYQARYLQSMLDMVTSIKSESDALAILGEINLDTKADVDALNQSLLDQVNLLQQSGTISIDTGNKLRNAFSGISEIFRNVREAFSSGKDVFSSGGGYSGGGYAGESWYDKQVEAFERLNRMGQKTTQEVVDFYRQMANAANISADDRIDAEDRLFDAIKAQIEETKQKQLDALNAQRDAIEAQAQAQIDSLNARKDRISSEIDEEIDALNEKIEKIEEEAQAQIDALKKVEKENDRIREKEEYERNRASILEDIASYESRSGIEARRAEREARQNLEDLDREYKEKLEDYEIQDKIEEIEAYRDAQIESIRDQIESLQEYKDEQIQAIDEQIEAINKRKEEELKSIDEQIAYVNEKFNESNINMMAYAQVFGDEIYNQYVGEFIEPMANGMVDGFQQANAIMIEEAKSNAASIRDIYLSEFISPVQSSISSLVGLATSALAMVSGNPILSAFGAAGTGIFASNSVRDYFSGSGNSGRTINNNINMNANIRNETDMNLLSNKILNQLTSGFKNLP